MLAILIKRVKEEGHIVRVIPHLVDDGLSILQYANDTILFMEHDIDKAKNMKLLLSAFEQLSGLKINFHKSEIFFLTRPRIMNYSMNNYLYARKDHSRLNI
jgi:hypothetical protein